MKYCKIKERARSKKETNLERNNQNTPNEIDIVEMLHNRGLEHLSEDWGKPIRVNSGYRCEALHRAVGE